MIPNTQIIPGRPGCSRAPPELTCTAGDPDQMPAQFSALPSSSGFNYLLKLALASNLPVRRKIKIKHNTKISTFTAIFHRPSLQTAASLITLSASHISPK